MTPLALCFTGSLLRTAVVCDLGHHASLPWGLLPTYISPLMQTWQTSRCWHQYPPLHHQALKQPTNLHEPGVRRGSDVVIFTPEHDRQTLHLVLQIHLLNVLLFVKEVDFSWH